MLIQKMVKQQKLSVQIVSAPIIRESNGLAMSSRNSKLSFTARERAGFIFEVLKSYLPENHDVLVRKLEGFGFELEYLEEYELGSGKRLFIAGFLEGVRLIDNVQLNQDT
jgi:pantoate--beta-alanine ligase